jgi:hypothetical protein
MFKGKGRHYKNMIPKSWQKRPLGRTRSTWNTLKPNLKIMYRRTGLNWLKKSPMNMLIKISGFCHDVDEIYALVRYHAASSGNPLPLDAV